MSINDIMSIVEVKEIMVSNEEVSWEIGELIADGWKYIDFIAIGETADFEYIQQGLVCVIGRPLGIVNIPRIKKMCLSLIKSGRHSEVVAGTTGCSVSGCLSKADYEVIFFDQYAYSYSNTVYFERDYTCPFICHFHMQENEAGARGIREPRSDISYPYSKGDGGQGFTKYLPLLPEEVLR
jgi:hypothetical protein